MSPLDAWAALCREPTPVDVGDRRLTLHRRQGRWTATAAEIDALLAPGLSVPRQVSGAAVRWDGRRARLLAAAIAELGAQGTHPRLRVSSQRATQVAWQHGRGDATDHALAAAHAGAVAALQRATTTQRAIGRSLMMMDDPEVSPIALEKLSWGLVRALRHRVGLGLHAALPDPAHAAHQAAITAARQRADVPLGAVLDLVFAFWLGGRDDHGDPVDGFSLRQ